MALQWGEKGWLQGEDEGGGGYVGVGQREFSGGCDKDFSLRLEDSPGYCDSV